MTELWMLMKWSIRIEQDRRLEDDEGWASFFLILFLATNIYLDLLGWENCIYIPYFQFVLCIWDHMWIMYTSTKLVISYNHYFKLESVTILSYSITSSTNKSTCNHSSFLDSEALSWKNLPLWFSSTLTSECHPSITKSQCFSNWCSSCVLVFMYIK